MCGVINIHTDFPSTEEVSESDEVVEATEDESCK